MNRRLDRAILVGCTFLIAIVAIKSCDGQSNGTNLSISQSDSDQKIIAESFPYKPTGIIGSAKICLTDPSKNQIILPQYSEFRADDIDAVIVNTQILSFSATHPCIITSDISTVIGDSSGMIPIVKAEQKSTFESSGIIYHVDELINNTADTSNDTRGLTLTVIKDIESSIIDDETADYGSTNFLTVATDAQIERIPADIAVDPFSNENNSAIFTINDLYKLDKAQSLIDVQKIFGNKFFLSQLDPLQDNKRQYHFNFGYAKQSMTSLDINIQDNGFGYTAFFEDGRGWIHKELDGTYRCEEGSHGIVPCDIEQFVDFISN